MSGDGSPRDGRARRAGVVVAIVALFVLGLAVFVLPFAFPTPPPVVTRFNATRLFSPDGDGRRDDAKVNVRLQRGRRRSRWRSRSDGATVRRLITDRTAPRGWVREDWDGRDDDGRVVPDGTYALKLRARAGKKQFNTTRAIVVDTEAPRPAEMTVESATLRQAGPGRVPRQLQLARPGVGAARGLPRGAGGGGDGRERRRRAPAGAAPGARRTTRSRWRWDGRRADGGQVPPGLYLIRASLLDAARNRVVRERTCWVGLPGRHGRALVRPRPARPVGVALRRTDGDPLPPVDARDPRPPPPHRRARRDPRPTRSGAQVGVRRPRPGRDGPGARPRRRSTPPPSGWSPTHRRRAGAALIPLRGPP